MLGKHSIKTWSASQGAIALSSAEAEFYAMIEDVLRAKGLLSLASQLGFNASSNVVKIGTDSSAAFLLLVVGARQNEAFGNQGYVASTGSPKQKGGC